jgi:hypothetical protein
MGLLACGLSGCRKPPPVVVYPEGNSPTTRALIGAGVSAGLQAKYGCEMGGCSPGYECREETGRCEPLQERAAGRPGATTSRSTDPLASSSTVAVSADGLLEIAGLDAQAIHAHGGPPANIDQITFRIRNLGDSDRPLRPTRVQLLGSQSCDEPPRQVRASPAVRGLHELPGPSPLVASWTAPAASEHEVLVVFDPVPATYTHCDRYAIKVIFAVASEELRSVAEVWATREADAP